MEKFWIFLFNQERLQQIQNLRIQHRQLRDQSNPFTLPEQNFLKLFRISKEAVHYFSSVSVNLPRSHGDTCIPDRLKIFAALNFLGMGSYQLNVGQNHFLGLSQPSVSRCLWQVVNVIDTHFLNLWIKFPRTAAEKYRIKEGFMEKFNFPNVIGTVDCTHISIIAPSQMHLVFPGRVYFNRKGYTSINTQIVCDSNLKVLSINAIYPGSTHDAAIWATSNIKQHLQLNFLNGDKSSYLLGDSGYTLQPWLLTPVINAAEETSEAAYTQTHIRKRNCVGRLNGTFKSRFRCCSRLRVLNYTPDRAANIIYACAVLHNMSIFCHNEQPEPNIIDENINEIIHDDVNNNWLKEGLRIRNTVIQTFFME